MTNFAYISSLPVSDNEDLVQDAWVQALATTDHRPPANTREELFERYDHIGGMVTTIYRRRKVDQYRQKIGSDLPLTNDLPVWYNTEDALDECTDEQLAAISYYLNVTNQGQPLSAKQKMKLQRLRKKTGLALKVDTHYDKET